MDFDAALQSFARLHGQFGAMLDQGLLVFARLLAFIFFAPIFNRKDIAFNIKLVLAMFLTITFLWIIPLDSAYGKGKPAEGLGFLYLILVNASIGALLAFIADLILQAVYCAGDFMNNQIGLSSAMIFDPSSRKQGALLETLFVYIAAIVFMHMGGLHWLIIALKRSFTVFPLTAATPDIVGQISLDYLIRVSGNVMLVGVELMAPVIVTTLAIDIILGVVNRTAQQIPVFQLSAAIKPAVGLGIMLATLPIFIQAVMNFLEDFSKIF